MSRLSRAMRLATPRQRMDARYRTLFSSDDGRVVLMDLLRGCGVLEISVQPNDPQQTAYYEGRRSVAIELMRRVRMGTPELIEIANARAPYGMDLEDQ